MVAADATPPATALAPLAKACAPSLSVLVAAEDAEEMMALVALAAAITGVVMAPVAAEAVVTPNPTTLADAADAAETAETAERAAADADTKPELFLAVWSLLGRTSPGRLSSALSPATNTSLPSGC